MSRAWKRYFGAAPQRELISFHSFANTLFLTVLSRYPTATELNAATTNLRSATNATARTQEGRNLLWSLYNKVDFIYNN